MSNNLTPLEVCERLIGPLDELAMICGYGEKAGYLWRKQAKGRDAGDLPSTRLMRRLLAHAAAKNIPLTADHLIWGAQADEIEALCAQGPDGAPPAFATSRRVQEAAE